MKKLIGAIAMILLAACTDVQEATAKPLASSQEGTVVRDISIHSNILGRDMLYSVYLPAGYSSEKQYPVLYLLHGSGGNQNEWWVYDDLADDADAMIVSGEIPEMIIVTPDGKTWMYIDNCYGNGLYYERYFFEELLPEVESHYSIRRERGTRAIGGFSMGGYGALRYGVMHHDMFCYVYAMSSVIGGYGATDMGDIITGYSSSELPGITLECGDRDYFTYDNCEFSKQLTQLGISHEHIERSGGHDWTFWSACTPKILRKVGGLFRDSSTGIASVRPSGRQSKDIYSLDGRRRESLKRGINIVDGLKVAIK